MKEATENVQERISVGDAKVSLIRYADDKAVVASNQRGLQYLMDSINKVSKEHNMNWRLILIKRQRSWVFHVKVTTKLLSVLMVNK